MDFLPWKSKSLNRGSVVVPLEVPRTEMVSLRLLVDLHRKAGIQKHLRKPGSSTQRNHWEKSFRKWRGFGISGGVDLAWIFWGQGKKGSKNPRQIHASFPEQSPRRFSRKSAPKSVPQNQRMHGELPP